MLDFISDRNIPNTHHNDRHQLGFPSGHPLDHPPLPPKPGVQLLQLPQEPFVRTDKPMSMHLLASILWLKTIKLQTSL